MRTVAHARDTNRWWVRYNWPAVLQRCVTPCITPTQVVQHRPIALAGEITTECPIGAQMQSHSDRFTGQSDGRPQSS